MSLKGPKPTQTTKSPLVEKSSLRQPASVAVAAVPSLELLASLAPSTAATGPRANKKAKTWNQIETDCKGPDGAINIHSAIKAIAGHKTQADTLESLSECVYGGMFFPEEMSDLDREEAFEILEEIASDGLIDKLKAILPTEGVFTLAYPHDFEG